MSRKVLVFAAVAVISAGVLVTAADKTVGQFVQDLARVKSLAATDPQIAADSLAAAGVPLPAGLDFSAPLTEGDVARISRSVGVRVTTNEPDAVFTSDQADQFFAAFPDISGNSGSGITTRANEGNCVVAPGGECAQQGADCERNGKQGFCMTTSCQGVPCCNCNTGKAKGKRKQVVTPDEPE